MLRLVLLYRLHQRRLPGRLLPPGRPHRHLFNRPQAGVLVRTTAAKTLSTGRRRLVRFRLRHHQHRVLGDGSSIPIYCVGQAQLPSSTKPLLLRDVLVAPALIKNLISVRQFTCDNLVSAEFDPLVYL